MIRNRAHIDDITVCYDNFDYMQSVRHQIVGDHGKMYDYTTAKLMRQSFRIPEGGLYQSMLKPEVPLTYRDIFGFDNDCCCLWEDVQRCLIINGLGVRLQTPITGSSGFFLSAASGISALTV